MRWGSTFLVSGFLVALLSTLAAVASVVYIDDFEVGPFDVSVDSGSQTDSETDSGLPMDRVVGGQRDVYLSYVSGGISPTMVDNTTLPGSLYYGSPPTASAWLRLQYGLAGSMNTDLTVGGVNNGIYFLYQYTEDAGTCIVTVTSSAGTFTLAKPTPTGVGDEPVLLSFLFSEFPGVDFTDVDSLTVIWTNIPTAKDFTVSFLATANEYDFHTPEPASACLLFWGIAFLLRRQIRDTSAT